MGMLPLRDKSDRADIPDAGAIGVLKKPRCWAELRDAIRCLDRAVTAWMHIHNAEELIGRRGHGTLVKVPAATPI